VSRPGATGGETGAWNLVVSATDWAGRARIAWLFTWGSYGLLLAQQSWYLLQNDAPWVIWLGKLLPLLVFLPGMLYDNLRSYIWLCFVSLYPFTALVISLFAEPHSASHRVGMVAVVTLFISAMLYVRWRARARRAVD
jgi:uncharacterized membrane protein